MKNKDKKKGKGKKAEKISKKEKIKSAKGKKPGKLKATTKALRREIEQLQRELQAKDEQLSALRLARDEPANRDEIDIPALSLDQTIDAGTVSERKKFWERPQYLRDRYEKHLEAGQAKGRARLNADRDLRRRFGEDTGYTEEELESILS